MCKISVLFYAEYKRLSPVGCSLFDASWGSKGLVLVRLVSSIPFLFL